MAIKTLTYQDIPASQRRKTANAALSRLREHLSDPTVTNEQGQKMRDRIMHLENWVAGNISTPEDK